MTMADADAPRHADSHGGSNAAMDARGDDLPRPSVADAAMRDVTPQGCPFLVAESGGWRLGMPSRDHRCAAVSPPAPLSPEKQIRLCLTPAHTGCATFLASVSARTERLGAAPVARATRWGLARTTSVIEDPGGLRARALAFLLDRRRWPAIPAIVLVLTLFALALSGFRAGTPPTAGATASPARPSTPIGTPRGTLGPSPSSAPIESVAASSAPSAAPTGAPGPAQSFRTYRVKSGDTLGAIANRFDVTVKEIVDLNGISDPARLQIGQLLRIPAAS